ncbi:hypothetical protein D3C84_903000 [compost metagenome]
MVRCHDEHDLLQAGVGEEREHLVTSFFLVELAELVEVDRTRTHRFDEVLEQRRRDGVRYQQDRHVGFDQLIADAFSQQGLTSTLQTVHQYAERTFGFTELTNNGVLVSFVFTVDAFRKIELLAILYQDRLFVNNTNLVNTTGNLLDAVLEVDVVNLDEWTFVSNYQRHILLSHVEDNQDSYHMIAVLGYYLLASSGIRE